MEWAQIVLIGSFLFSILGFLGAILLLARNRSHQRQPGTTLAWLLGMVFLPVVAIPLYLLFGGRRLKQLSNRKARLKLLHEGPGSHVPPGSPAQEALFSLPGTPRPTEGNRIELLDDGQEVFSRMMAMIASACESIYFETFILSRDPVGAAIVAALAAKARSGVKVRLLIDGLGSFWTAHGNFLDDLRSSGAEVGVFMPMIPFRRKWSANLRLHRKIYMVDDREALVGGKNLAQEYLGPLPDSTRWKDATVILRGPAVHSLNEVFAADWLFATGRVLEPPTHDYAALMEENATVQTVVSGPDAYQDPFYDTLLAAMLQAKVRVWIVSPYFVPDETILRVLCILAKLGRDVRVIVPLHSNSPISDIARRFPLRELDRAGASIRYYQPAMLHAKLFLIDDTVASVGSPNMDMRSLYLNYEVSLFLYSQPEVEAVHAMMERLLNDCSVYTRQEGKVRGYLQETLENIARILSPLI